jgi:hypothetical protein
LKQPGIEYFVYGSNFNKHAINIIDL